MECRHSRIRTLVFVFVLGSTSILQAKPKYVIILIGDGMGFEQVEAGRLYLDPDDQGLLLSFQTLPYQGQVSTHSANSSVTDSAAAATSIATGFKVDNNVIAVAKPGDGSELETLLEYYKLRLRSSGLVTTTYMTHATPAAFGAHEISRDRYNQIADDYLTETRPNLLLGGNSYMGGAAAAGYSVVADRAELQTLADQLDQSGALDVHVNGQFGSGYMPYEYDGLGALPHLSEMTANALAVLDNDAEGFFLMVEGGRIDHACHAHDLRRTVQEVVEFNNAVQVAIDWINAVPGREAETLLIVTADHETGGLTLDSGGARDADGYPLGSFSSTGHTDVDVPVYGFGVNADLIQPLMDNTDFFAIATAGNVQPEAIDQTVGVMQDDSVAITLDGTDSDHDPLTFRVTLPPVNGTLDESSLPDVTYTPAPGYSGPDGFEYVANDGDVDSLAATVTINVTPPNAPPVAVDDTAETDEDVGLVIDVLANDSDPEGGALFLDSVGNPANGSTAMNPDDTVTYIPAADYHGEDSFSYTVRDDVGAAATATVTVTVWAANDAPVAVNDSAVTTVETPVVIVVLANDTDVDGDTLTVAAVSDPANGAAVIEPDDTVTYVPDAGFEGSDAFTYTASDGKGGTDTALVSVAVTVPNNPPVAVDDGPVPTAEDTAVSISVLANDSDPDSDPLAVEAVSDPANGAAVIEIDMTVTYTPDLNFSGPDSFTYTISDGRGGTDTATVTVDVQEVNDAPLAVDDGPVATDEDVPVNIDVLANDIDPEGDILTVVTTSNPANGAAWIEPDETVTYTPDPGFTGVDTFTYEVSDGNGGTDTATVTLDVQAVAPPYIDDLALDEVLVEGVQAGSLVDTQASDDSYESITEVSAGNRKFSWSSLEHEWTFDVTGGNPLTFNVEAWRQGSGMDGFIFAYSTDGETYTDMLTVTATADDNTYQTFELPAQLSGTVHVRVTDSDHSKDEFETDTIHIDHLFIRSFQPMPQASSPSPPDGAVAVPVSVTLSWVAGIDAVSHDVYLGTSPVLGAPDYQGQQAETTFTPAALAASTTYYWRIDEVASGGTVTTGELWSFTTAATCVPTMLHVASIVYDTVPGSKGTKYGRATVTVEDNCGSPAAGAEVFGHFIINGTIVDPVPSGLTDADGVVQLLTTEAYRKPTFEFVVDDIVHPTLGFSATAGNAQAPAYGDEMAP